MTDHASILVTMVGIMLSLLVGGIALLSFAFVFGLAGLLIAEMIKMGKSKLYTFMGFGSYVYDHRCDHVYRGSITV